jgi:betaine-aldehyde dehydrogenase
MTKCDLLIDGEIVSPTQGKYFDSINPSTGKPFAQVADAAKEDMQQAIVAARKAFDIGPWPRLSFAERGEYLKRIANIIREHAHELADLESQDTGKTSKQTTFIDVPTVADTFEYFSAVGEQLADQVNPVKAPVKSVTAREPMGVVGAIIPWNYPLIMFGWKVAPALIAGNTVVFRPSSTACVSIMRLAQLLEQVSLPRGVLNVVPCQSHEVADELVMSPQVDMITFTGGTTTGQEIMRRAAGTTKKLTLELGGKSPNVVFADCDLEAAVGGTMSAIFMNQGQMCTAGSRLLLQDSIYDQFLDLLVKRTQSLKIGNSQSYETDFGPLVSAKQRDHVLHFVKRGISEGAQVLCGGHVPVVSGFERGFYFEPTIFTDVKPEMTIAQEEIFGPVLVAFKFADEEEAVTIANDTVYGLAACVWSKDLEKAQRVARRLRCGTVWINTYGGFYNEASYGGYKQSGFGRELGVDGLLEYTQAKHICLDQTPGGRPLVSSWF